MRPRNFRFPFLGALLAVVVLTAAAAASFEDFVRGFDAPAAPPPERVDLIVALSGGTGRFEAAVRMLEEERAPMLLLVGFQPRAVAARLESEPAFARLYREGRIVVEPRSGSTFEDAERSRALVVGRRAQSVLLITSVYHLRRAALTFRTLLPPAVDLHTWPVRAAAFRTDAWYEDEASRRVVLTEFLKYLYYRLRLPIHVMTSALWGGEAPRRDAQPPRERA